MFALNQPYIVWVSLRPPYSSLGAQIVTPRRLNYTCPPVAALLRTDYTSLTLRNADGLYPPLPAPQQHQRAALPRTQKEKVPPDRFSNDIIIHS